MPQFPYLSKVGRTTCTSREAPWGQCSTEPSVGMKSSVVPTLSAHSLGLGETGQDGPVPGTLHLAWVSQGLHGHFVQLISPSKLLPSPLGQSRASQRKELRAPQEERMEGSWEQAGPRASPDLSCLSVGRCSLICIRIEGGSAPLSVLGGWSAIQAGSPCVSYRFPPAGGALCMSPSPLLFLKGCGGPSLVQPWTADFGLGSTALSCTGRVRLLEWWA